MSGEMIQILEGKPSGKDLKFAVVVGTILIVINHGDTILAGELTRTNYLKMGLTVIVPYLVSVFLLKWMMVWCLSNAGIVQRKAAGLCQLDSLKQMKVLRKPQ